MNEPLDLSKEQFIERLVAEAGWTREEAESHWNEIQEDGESGYDGP